MNPDGPPNELYAQIEMLAANLRETINTAWFHGLKDGMEVAAKICDNMIEPLRRQYGPAFANVAQGCRDGIRVSALQLEAPK